MGVLDDGVTGLVKTIIFINTFGGIVAGVWLAITGDWWALGYGLIGVFVSHWFVSLLLMPGLLIGAAGAKLAAGRRWGAARWILGVSSLYTAALMFGWCVLVTAGFLGHERHASLLPMLLWAYGIATAPWIYLGAKDQEGGGGNEFSLMSLFAMEAGYLLGGVVFLVTGDAMWFFLGLGGALLANWIFGMALAWDLEAA